jgi:hypothetical protein
VDVPSALRFALEAEQAGADFAAAAGVAAPDEAWRAKLEEIVCAHDDRAPKLAEAGRAGAGGTTASRVDLDGSAFAAVLGGEPAPTWPAAAEQMAAVEDTIADYHEAFAACAEVPLQGGARLFTKAAAQSRAAAAELRAMLG